VLPRQRKVLELGCKTLNLGVTQEGAEQSPALPATSEALLLVMASGRACLVAAPSVVAALATALCLDREACRPARIWAAKQISLLAEPCNLRSQPVHQPTEWG
jgi:hypothetical protein